MSEKLSSGLFQIRVYDPVHREASAFDAVAEIEMDPIQASEVNRALCLAKAAVRFWPMPKKEKK